MKSITINNFEYIALNKIPDDLSKRSAIKDDEFYKHPGIRPLLNYN